MGEGIETYLYRYPQLTLPVQTGMSGDARYTDIVRRGKLPQELPNPFYGNPADKIFSIDTPIGVRDVLYLADRRDFVRFVQVMAHRCEPVEIPDSMGAVALLGVTNWRKIENHKRKWAVTGGTDWKAEFQRFTANKGNYQDELLVVSDGPYSAVPGEQLGLEEAQWRSDSLTVRIWHELTHLVCRKLWLENKHAIRDEIVADCIGLLAAFGRYDPTWALRILGVREGVYLPGGRLQNYLTQEMPDDKLLGAVERQVALLAQQWQETPEEPFVFLRIVEEKKLGMENWL